MNFTVREEYAAALKEGQKEYARLTALGKDPGPAVLEELLPDMGKLTVQELKSQEIPMDRIMIETDAPFLAPEPYRGRRNDSGYVHLVAEKIAAIKGISPGEVERITWENGKRFFGIK